jgi:Zn-dependent protease
MPLGRTSIQLARLFGIRIGVSPSWFFVLFLMIYFLTGYFGDVLNGSDTEAFVVAVCAALLFFVSLVLHELGHALVGRRNGIAIQGIDLWFFGGLAKLSRDTESPGEEFRVAAAGPAVTVAVVALCFAAGALLTRTGDFLDSAILSSRATTPAVALLGWLATINVVLFVFNMIPAFPLDGGRIARAAAWRATGDKNRATRLAGRIGQGFSYLLIAGGLALALSLSPLNGIYIMVLGWFLGQGAKGAVAASDFSERIDGVTAADLMDAEPIAVPEGATVAQAQDEFFLRYHEPWFPVVDPGGHIIGILRQASVSVAPELEMPVHGLIDDAAAADAQIRDDTPLDHLLASEPLRRLGALLVVDREGVLRGVLTLEQVRRALTAAAPSRVS